MINIDLIKEKFVCNIPRRGQLEAVKFIIDSFESGKKFVILEAPVGAGKSPIAMTVSRFYSSSFYLTIQKYLQSQLIRDFGPNGQISRDYNGEGLVELKGRNAYPCTFYDLHAQKLVDKKLLLPQIVEKAKKANSDCSGGYCKKHLSQHKCASCFPNESNIEKFQAEYNIEYSTCPFYEQVGLAINSPKVLMNFSSFLFQTQYTKRFPSRELLIVDESHHQESQLMDFITLTINDLTFMQRGIKLPELEDPEAYALWFHDHGIELEIGRMIKEAKDLGDTKAEDEATRLYHKYNRFMKCVADGMTDWICEYKKHTLSKDKGFASVTLKPVFIDHFTDDLLFKYGKRILMMSATILDVGIMAKSLGIDKDDIAFFRMGNYFPKENRPIYIQAAAKMTGGKDRMSEWSGPLVEKVNEIIAKYPNDRGIIHTHNFAIANLIMNCCKEKNRLLFQNNFASKEQMLLKHSSMKNGVIVAPAMHEGLDLKDELSRFQILAKIPYPNFYEDKQLARRVELDRNYINWITCIKMIQSVGRSVRSDTDWAHTYIIDESINKLLRDAKSMIPKWFTEAIVR